MSASGQQYFAKDKGLKIVTEERPKKKVGN